MENKMPQVVGGTYEIIGEIGSGGGGIVYLAEHQRLHKKVVLKADRKTITTKEETLRREVDALKNLSHTYIPQVYDYLVENGVVYTVMDYIDGESFDKLLKRKEKFTQPQVVAWACQLLEALSYLHSRPPNGILHGDIKPANIMCTSQGEIRLIDFNIALILGEEGAVAVGRSFGYASPEHYGAVFNSGNNTGAPESNVITDVSQDSISYVETILESKPLPPSSGGTGEKKTILIDVRSDIYSLGATLYHMITGLRPAQKAIEVAPLQAEGFSESVLAIVAKAMNPDANARYQTATEMYNAFVHLREGDERTRRYKRGVKVIATVLSLILCTGVSTIFVGLKQMEKLQNAYVLAEYSANKMMAGDRIGAIEDALAALPLKKTLLTPPHTAQAQKALTDALQVYDLSDGWKRHRAITLPSSPLSLELSKDGKTAAAIYEGNIAVFDTDTGTPMVTLPTVASALAEGLFLNNHTIVYAGKDGIQAYDLTENKALWTGKQATAIAISSDATVVAAINKEEHFATIYDAKLGGVLQEMSFGEKKQRVTVNDSFANPRDNLFALNEGGTLLAVSFADGSLWVYDLKEEENHMEVFDHTSGYKRFTGGFYEQYFAFTGVSEGESVFAVIDMETMEQTGGFTSENPFWAQVDENGIALQTDNLLVWIHPETGEQKPLVTMAEQIKAFATQGGHTLVATKDAILYFDQNASLSNTYQEDFTEGFLKLAEGIALIGSVDQPTIKIMQLEHHQEAEVFAYDASYPHDEARLGEDGKTVMLFSYTGFRICDFQAKVIAEVAMPNADQVYDQQYRRDDQGARLEVIYNDGTVRTYGAADGRLINETKGEKPDASLKETFFTNDYRIEAPLHAAPVVYEKETNIQVCTLETEDYLTYVTQVGDDIVTEYVTADGMRYGLLLNESCEVLAKLPYLCDIVGEEIHFDYPTGHLRKSRIYHSNDLIEMAHKELKNQREELE